MSTDEGAFTAYMRKRTVSAARSARSDDGVDARVASRITEGRTDAADRPYHARRDREEAAQRRPDVEDAREQAVEENGTASREPRARRGAEPSSPSPRRRSSEPQRELSGEERTVEVVDADGAMGTERGDTIDAADDPALPDANDALPTAVPQVHTPPPVAAQGQVAAFRAGAAPAATQAANAAQRVTVQAPAQANAQTRAESAAKPQAASAPSSPRTLDRAESILEQLRVHVRAGDREATIHLRPEELGRVRLHVKVDAGAVHASIAAESAEALAVLESHAPELRAWLAREGRETVELSFSLMDPREGSERSNEQGDSRKQGSNRGRGSAAETIQPQALVRALATQTHDGGVDLVA